MFWWHNQNVSIYLFLIFFSLNIIRNCQITNHRPDLWESVPFCFLSAKLGNFESCVSHFERALTHAKLQEDDSAVNVIQKVPSLSYAFHCHLFQFNVKTFLIADFYHSAFRPLMKQSNTYHTEDVKILSRDLWCLSRIIKLKLREQKETNKSHFPQMGNWDIWVFMNANTMHEWTSMRALETIVLRIYNLKNSLI